MICLGVFRFVFADYLRIAGGIDDYLGFEGLAAACAESCYERSGAGVDERCEFAMRECHAIELAEYIVAALGIVAHRHSAEGLHHAL